MGVSYRFRDRRRFQVGTGGEVVTYHQIFWSSNFSIQKSTHGRVYASPAGMFHNKPVGEKVKASKIVKSPWLYFPYNTALDSTC